MVRTRQDKYAFGQSQDKVVSNAATPIRLDVLLQSTSYTIGQTIEGRVMDSASQASPISGALVKLTDEFFDSIAYVITDSQGRFLLSDIPQKSSYNIFASSKGMELSQQGPFSMVQGENKVVNFNLKVDPALQLGAILGEVRGISNNILSGVVVSLYKVVSGVSTLFGITYTNEYGQYAFREVQNGTYSVKFSMLGFLSKSIDNVILSKSGDIIPQNASLEVDKNASMGTLSGTVVNNSNVAINRADVILYSIDANNIQTPVAYTKTNASGVYLFTNVPEGKYKVMANELEIVTVVTSTSLIVEGPDIDKITIAKKATLIPYSIDMSKGTLTNGALVDPTLPSYVKNIGGTSNGTASTTVNIPSDSIYEIRIKYLSPNKNRQLNIDVDGINIMQGTALKTAGANDTDALEMVNFVFIQKGIQTLTLGGDGINDAPWISSVSLKEFRQPKYVMGTEGVLGGGATIVSNMITGIGGSKNGSRTVTVNADANFQGTYSFRVYYSAADANRVLRVTSSGSYKDYTIKKDDTFIEIPVNLLAGNNNIIFQGNGVAQGPDLMQIEISYLPNEAIIEAESGVISGGAIISNGLVKNIGGTQDGAVTFTYNAPEETYYDIVINYLAADNTKKVEVLVNGMNPQTIAFDATSGVAGNKVIGVYLNKGNNTIKIQK